MAIKKSELYSSLWKSCDELRGGMDASQYKDYVLVLLFVKYVSDKYAGQKDALIDVPAGARFSDMVALKGDKEIGDKINKIIAKLAKANDLTGVIDVADFNNPEKLGRGKEMVDRLSNLVSIFNSSGLDFKSNRAEGDDILGDAYEYLMRHFATESGKSKGQFYTPAEVSRIMSKVIGAGSAKNTNQTIYDPTCGSGSLLLKAHDEAYGNTHLNLAIYGQEMDNATAALAKMNMFLHDCPSAEIWRDNTLSSPYFKQGDGKLKTFDFAVANPPFSTKAWSTGFDPANDEYNRFEYGTPPAKNGDYAFLLHILTSLKSSGKGAIILPHGVLFRGGSEADIRKQVVHRGYIKGIIGLPANLFYGTGIPACIIVLDKENASTRKGPFIIDASKSFIKDGPKNRLRDQDIHKIVDVFTKQIEIDKYSRLVPLSEIEANDYNLNIPRYIDSSDAEDLQDIEAHLRGGIPNRDIDDLARYWEVFPGVGKKLFAKADRVGYSKLKVALGDIKATIFDHEEFTAFNKLVNARFKKWKKANIPNLTGIAIGSHPKALIEAVSESLLKTFKTTPLLDAYDVYQHLMTYWAETMQDDVYMIVGDGWEGAEKVRLIVEDKKNKNKEKADIVIGKKKYKADLIPPALVIARYFSAEQAAIEIMEADVDSITQAMEELNEEHGSEDGALEDIYEEGKKIKRPDILKVIGLYEQLAIEECMPKEHKTILAALKLYDSADAHLRAREEANSSEAIFAPLRGKSGKLGKGNIKKRLKLITKQDSKEHAILAEYISALEQASSAKKKMALLQKEARQKLTEAEKVNMQLESFKSLKILRNYLELFDQEKAMTNKTKEAHSNLATTVLKKYPKLTEDEIKTLVVEDKWLATLAADLQSELDRVSQTLTGRINKLAERYATPLPKLTEEVEALSAKVDEHLQKMGMAWN